MFKGISLHIGLNEVDSSAYKVDVPFLPGPESDALSMLKLASQLGYETSLLLGSNATSQNVASQIDSVASKLNTGDIFLLTYSGHGSSIPDKSGDEKDKRDETWVLYDREFLDDEIALHLARIKPSVRVVILSDSCHSGTVAKSPISAPKFLKPKFLSMELSNQIYELNQQKYDEIRKSTPKQDLVDEAVGCLISGCQDNEPSYDDNGGLFTKAFLKVWGDGKDLTPAKLTKSITAILRGIQTPNLLYFGKQSSKFTRSPLLVI